MLGMLQGAKLAPSWELAVRLAVFLWGWEDFSSVLMGGMKGDETWLNEWRNMRNADALTTQVHCMVKSRNQSSTMLRDQRQGQVIQM